MTTKYAHKTYFGYTLKHFMMLDGFFRWSSVTWLKVNLGLNLCSKWQNSKQVEKKKSALKHFKKVVGRVVIFCSCWNCSLLFKMRWRWTPSAKIERVCIQALPEARWPASFSLWQVSFVYDRLKSKEPTLKHFVNAEWIPSCFFGGVFMTGGVKSHGSRWILFEIGHSGLKWDQ